MQIEVETITPEVAAIMLENNPANRNIKKNHVDAMARDMIAGRWQTNGDAIRMNCDGSLIDGQHRLTACVKSGVPFQTVVISGLDADVRATIDGGAKRTHGDRLGMMGVSNATHVSAATRLIGGIATGEGKSVRFTSQELDAILAEHPGEIQRDFAFVAVVQDIGHKVIACDLIGAAGQRGGGHVAVHLPASAYSRDRRPAPLS